VSHCTMRANLARSISKTLSLPARDVVMHSNLARFMSKEVSSLSARDIVLQKNQELLNAVMANDWTTYKSMCCPSLSCFEAESRSHLAVGLDFHKYYYDLAASSGPIPVKQASMASPHVRFVGKTCAILSYVRLVQFVGNDGAPQTARAEETRVWELKKQDPANSAGSDWVHVHFHRSNWS